VKNINQCPQLRTTEFRIWTVRLTFSLMAAFGSIQSSFADLPDFVQLVEDNTPSIVNISTIQSVSSNPGGRDRDLEELLRRLSPQDRSELELNDDIQPRQRGGVGSGFIISSDGYIITNHHVVSGADSITVTLNDRREFSAQVIGTDELSDMALLKIDGKDLAAVRFGDSEQVKVGEWVLAIGSPFGLDFSAAAGIVSAKGRTVPGNATNYVAFIQTDVAINQGNSGGPLFNLKGEVIGINSQILSSSGGSNGISFAIPSNVALNVVEQLRDSGAVSRGLLGVVIKDVNHALAVAFQMSSPRGAFVDDVQPGSAAQRAGILNNDIIVEFDGRRIDTSAQLPFYVGQVKPGTNVEISVVRDGTIMVMPITVDSLPGNSIAAMGTDVRPPRSNSLGITVTEFAQTDITETGVTGVLVEQVREGPARLAGLNPGDLIVMLNRQAVTSVEHFNSLLNELPDTGYIPLRVMRQDPSGALRGTTVVVELK